MTTLALLKDNIQKTQNVAKLYLASASRLSPIKTVKGMTELQLEPYDALCGRFERIVEIVISKLSKSVDYFEAGGATETARDRLNLLEKLGLISSVDLWFNMRDVCNKIAHEYMPEAIAEIYSLLLQEYAREIGAFGTALDTYYKKIS